MGRIRNAEHRPVITITLQKTREDEIIDAFQVLNLLLSPIRKIAVNGVCTRASKYQVQEECPRALHDSHRVPKHHSWDNHLDLPYGIWYCFPIVMRVGEVSVSPAKFNLESAKNQGAGASQPIRPRSRSLPKTLSLDRYLSSLISSSSSSSAAREHQRQLRF